MYRKIRSDEESLNSFEFWGELNKAREGSTAFHPLEEIFFFLGTWRHGRP